MKKILLIGLAIITACTLMVGCNDASAKTNKLHYMKMGEIYGRVEIHIYVDPETGVQYIVFDKAAENIFVVPRLNADGKPMIHKEY